MGLYADMSIYVMIGSVIIFNYLEVPKPQSIERKLVSAGGMPSIDLIGAYPDQALSMCRLRGSRTNLEWRARMRLPF